MTHIWFKAVAEMKNSVGDYHHYDVTVFAHTDDDEKGNLVVDMISKDEPLP